MSNTPVTTLHTDIPLALAERMEAMAARIERPQSWIIKQALSAWIAQEEERERLTREAMADVDAGRTISHEEMLVWAEKLTAND